MGFNHSIQSLFKAGIAIAIGLFVAHYAYRAVTGSYLIENVTPFLAVVWVTILTLVAFTLWDRRS